LKYEFCNNPSVYLLPSTFSSSIIDYSVGSQTGKCLGGVFWQWPTTIETAEPLLEQEDEPRVRISGGGWWLVAGWDGKKWQITAGSERVCFTT